MKRVWGHVLAAVSLVAGVAVAFSACVHDDSTIFVQSVLAPQTSSQAGALCTWNSDPTQPFISSGVLDLELRPEYDAEFLVGNQMAAQANSSQLQTETSFVEINAAVVRITSSNTVNGVVTLANYTRLATATIPPASGNNPGYTPIGPVTILDEPTLISSFVQGQLVPGGTVRLVAHVKFSGKSLGGQSVESNEFEFPVDICSGCLIAFSQQPAVSAAQLRCLGQRPSHSAIVAPTQLIACFQSQAETSRLGPLPLALPELEYLYVDLQTGTYFSPDIVIPSFGVGAPARFDTRTISLNNNIVRAGINSTFK